MDEVSVSGITASLKEKGEISGKPYQLNLNKNQAYQGSVVLGTGFILAPEEANNLIKNNPNNEDVLFPYLVGEDLNSRFDQSPSRWVIQFNEMNEKDASAYVDVWNIAENRVKTERQKKERLSRILCKRSKILSAQETAPCPARERKLTASMTC